MNPRANIVYTEVCSFLFVINRLFKSPAFSFTGLNTEETTKVILTNKYSGIVQGLQSLQELLCSNKDPDCLAIFAPFLQVLNSKEVSGQLVEQAIVSVTNLIAAHVVDKSELSATCLAGILNAALDCRFEATEPVYDEIVLMKILRLIEKTVQCKEIASVLTLDLAKKLLHTAFTISFLSRVSEIARSYSENWLCDLLLSVTQVDSDFIKLTDILTIIDEFSKSKEFGQEKTKSAIMRLLYSVLLRAHRTQGLDPRSAAVQETLKHLTQSIVLESTNVFKFALKPLSFLLISYQSELRPHESLILGFLLKKLDADVQDIDSDLTCSFLIADVLTLFSVQPNFFQIMFAENDCVYQHPYLFQNIFKAIVRLCTVKGLKYKELRSKFVFILSVLVHSFSDPAIEPSPKVSNLIFARKRKSLVDEAVQKFNENPKRASEFLSKSGLIEEPFDKGYAEFLKSNGIDKKSLGELLSKPANKNLLELFLADCDMKGKRIDEALRIMLESFRLPGEAQQISAIMEAFAKMYFETKPKEFKTRDAAYVLSYSIIMLNTDLFNHNVKKKMTLDAFTRNNRGVNSGENFDQAYLEEIYNAIKHCEIVMPEEQEKEAGFGFTWRSTVCRPWNVPELTAEDLRFLAGFETNYAWKEILTVISFQLEVADSDLVLTKLTDLIQAYCVAATKTLNCEMIDSLLLALYDQIGIQSSNFVNTENRLKCNPSAYFSMITMFVVFRDFGSNVRSGWRLAFKCIGVFFASNVLSEEFTIFEDFTQVAKPGNFRSQLSPSRSMFQNITTFFGKSPELSKNPLEVILKCIETCKVDSLFKDSVMLDNDSFAATVESGTLENIEALDQKQYKIAVFYLEKIADVLIYNKDRAKLAWKIFFDHVDNVIHIPGLPVFVTERAVISLIRVLKVCGKSDSELFAVFALVRSLPPATFGEMAEQLMAGVQKFLEAAPAESANVLDALFILISITASHPKAKRFAFGALNAMFSGQFLLHADSQVFSQFVHLFESFSVMTKGSEKDEYALRSLQKLYDVHCNLSALEMKSLLTDRVMPTLLSICSFCEHGQSQVRQNALSTLQKSLLHRDFAVLDIDFSRIFTEILFPMMRTLHPENHLKFGNFDETSARVIPIACKVFLQYQSSLDPQNSSRILFNLIDELETFNSFKVESITEAVLECLKNMLLVLSTSDSLTEEIWDQVWVKVGKFLPNLRFEVFAKPESHHDLEVDRNDHIIATQVGETRCIDEVIEIARNISLPEDPAENTDDGPSEFVNIEQSNAINGINVV